MRALSPLSALVLPSWISTVFEARWQRDEGGQTGPKPRLPGTL